MHPFILPGIAIAAVAGYLFKDKILPKKAGTPAAAPAASPPGVPAPAGGGIPSPAAIPGGSQAPLMPLPAVPAAAPAQPAPTSSDPKKATVTTNDPPPSGDLIVRSGPSMASPQIGGAEKNGTVDVLTWNAGTADGSTWAKVRWAGGNRWPKIEGYVKRQFLKP